MLGKNRHVARILVIVCIAAVTAVAGIAQADDGGWGGGHCGKEQRGGFKKMEKKLGLTDAQKAQAKAIFEGNRDVMKPIHTALQTERKSLQTLMHADTIDEAAIRAETAKIAGIQADLNVNRAKVGAQFRAILTPAQQAILKTVDHKRHKKGEAAVDPAE